jgi:hypothetical protein
MVALQRATRLDIRSCRLLIATIAIASATQEPSSKQQHNKHMVIARHDPLVACHNCNCQRSARAKQQAATQQTHGHRST